jgi:tetratricopeptide (TPR) repeat protein
MTEIPESQILTCNKLAMEWLRKGKLPKAEEYIIKAQKLLTSRMKSKQTYHLWAITYNNLGCLHKRKGDLQKALKFLDLALEKEENFSRDILNLAGIHLNMSAIYSQMNSHEISLKHALSAKKVLLSKAEKDQNTWVSLVIAYQSAGFEQECLNFLESAKELYLKGWEIAQDHLGAFHTMTEKIKKNYQILQKNLKQVKPGQNRSKTPSLLPKTSNVSLASGKNSKIISLKENHHFKAESIKNIDTLELLINEIEIGKSESSTEVQSQSLGKQEGKLFRKIQFERLPRFEEKNVKSSESLRKNSQRFGKVGENVSRGESFGKVNDSVRNHWDKGRIEEEQFKIETDSEGMDSQDNYEDDFHDDEEVNRGRHDEMSIKDILSSHETSQNDLITISKSSKNEKINETILEIESEPTFQPIKITSEKEVQTEIPNKKTQEVQTKPSPFRRIAAITIQKHWRDHKKRKNPDFFQYLSSLKSARLEAETGLSRVAQLKQNYIFHENLKKNEPVPQHSKIQV